jgi:hypothetical protein
LATCTGIAGRAGAAAAAPAGCVDGLAAADPRSSHPAATTPNVTPINAATTHRLVQLIIMFPEQR